MEFMILASSNINFKLYGLGDRGILNASQREVSDAWLSKMEQVYEKAKILFMNQPEWLQIDSIYKKAQNKIKNEKKKLILLICAPFLSFGATILFVLLLNLFQ